MKIDADTARALAEVGGLTVDAERAERIAPYVADMLRSAAALAELEMDLATTAGPPWGAGAPDD